MSEDIRVGDMVEVVDGRGDRRSEVGMRLVVIYIELPYSNNSLLEFADSDVEVCMFRVKKVKCNRHPHADLIHKWADDTSIEFEQRVSGKEEWSTMTQMRVMLDQRFNLDVRIKQPKTPAELEKESILASMKELEENTAKTLAEMRESLLKLEV